VDKNGKTIKKMRKLTIADFDALSLALEDARKNKKDAKNKSLREIAKHD